MYLLIFYIAIFSALELAESSCVLNASVISQMDNVQPFFQHVHKITEYTLTFLNLSTSPYFQEILLNILSLKILKYPHVHLFHQMQNDNQSYHHHHLLLSFTDCVINTSELFSERPLLYAYQLFTLS